MSQKYKKGKHLEEKIKEKEMPPWWRYNEVRHPPTNPPTIHPPTLFHPSHSLKEDTPHKCTGTC